MSARVIERLKPFVPPPVREALNRTVRSPAQNLAGRATRRRLLDERRQRNRRLQAAVAGEDDVRLDQREAARRAHQHCLILDAPATQVAACRLEDRRAAWEGIGQGALAATATGRLFGD